MLKKKIVPLRTLVSKVNYWRKKGKRIVFTNGCFDLLHYGHVLYLEKAKTKKNRILIVGVNSDTSVKKIKGPKRPINGEKARAGVVAALACVDYVTIFSEETPYNLIKKIKPDILIKGADWRGKGVVGEDVVRQNGGRVEFIRYVPNYSTTRIIATIKRT